MAQGMKAMPTANIALSKRSRNSNKCEIRVPSASSPGSPASLMGRFGVGRGGVRIGYGRIGCMHGRRGRRRDGMGVGGIEGGAVRTAAHRAGTAFGRTRAAARRVHAGIRLSLRLQQFFRADFAL